MVDIEQNKQNNPYCIDIIYPQNYSSVTENYTNQMEQTRKSTKPRKPLETYPGYVNIFKNTGIDLTIENDT